MRNLRRKLIPANVSRGVLLAKMVEKSEGKTVQEKRQWLNDHENFKKVFVDMFVQSSKEVFEPKKD